MSRTVCPSAISSPIHSGTRLQTDEAKRQASEIVENLRPSQLDMRYRAIARVGGVHLEDMLGDVETNDSDLHRMLLLAYLHQPPQWHAPGAGSPAQGRAARRRDLLQPRLDHRELAPARSHAALGYKVPAPEVPCQLSPQGRRKLDQLRRP